MAARTMLVGAALVGLAAAECSNACSGHGQCGEKDACKCYANYQGNDCSERTCYFGLAHVDSPKGDLNADGLISGPLTTVVTGSEVYPWGTTEQFPNANSNEGHFYMECSNKGICDRKSGTCDCFDGYTGTACARASCPNDCSGHGTCESIKELAEMRAFDTNAHHAPSTRPANSDVGHDYNAAIEESYSYDLWDSDKTMGCKCDPVYYGADCSLKKCKYGVDPLYYDSTDGAIHQTTVVHLGSTGGDAGSLGVSSVQTFTCTADGGTFTLTHAGQTTATIAFGASTADVVTALEALSSVTSVTVSFDTGAAACANGGITSTLTFAAADDTSQLSAGIGSLTRAVGTESITLTTTTVGEPSTLRNRYPDDISGTFKIIFYDVFGEKYATKDINAANSLTPLAVRNALEALPNGVISNENTDVTGLAPAAVTVAMQKMSSAADITKTGGIGAGKSGSDTAVGAGLGTTGTHTTTATAGAALPNGVGSGPEFTVTFTTNPGILKSIELDTRGILNQGVDDYWVANSRQGQFNSRYSKNLGRVNTLMYGSTKLFTNTDLTGEVTGGTTTASSLVKVGGQEFQVVAENAAFLTLSEPFLGASIQATLTATGAELGSSHTYAAHGNIVCTNCATAFDAATNTITETATNGGYTHASFVGTWIELTDAGTPAVNIGAQSAAQISSGTLQSSCQGKILSSAGGSTVLAPGHNCVGFTGQTVEIKVAKGQFVAAVTGGSNKAAEVSVVGVDTEIVVQHLQSGAALSVGGCSFTVSKRGVTASQLEIALGGNVLGAGGGALGVDNNFDCNPVNGRGPDVAGEGWVFSGEFGTPGTPVYRRSDDPNNQNVYKAPADTGAQLASNLMLTRGNDAAYLVDATSAGFAAAVISTGGGTVDQAFTLEAATSAGILINEPFFVNGRGPMTALAAVAASGTSLTVKNPLTAFGKFFPRPIAVIQAATKNLIKWPVQKAISSAADATLVAGSVLLLDGRRYRVRARGSGAGIDGQSKVTLAENYAGGSLEKICTNCVAVATNTGTEGGVLKTFGATGGVGAQLNLVAGDRIMQSGNIHGDFLTTIQAATSASEYVTNLGGSHGTALHFGADLATTAESATLSLYKTRYGAKGAAAVTMITESAVGANTYNYVAQCANRGTCDSATGICKCFKGYAGDNCAKQNMLSL
jgi:hypothetical protein